MTLEPISSEGDQLGRRRSFDRSANANPVGAPPRVSVVIPTLNESSNLIHVLPRESEAVVEIADGNSLLLEYLRVNDRLSGDHLSKLRLICRLHRDGHHLLDRYVLDVILDSYLRLYVLDSLYLLDLLILDLLDSYHCVVAIYCRCRQDITGECWACDQYDQSDD